MVLTNSLSLTTRSIYQSAPTDASFKDLIIMASLLAKERDEEQQAGARKPADLVVVLDKSGSMDGAKLDLCKKTLDFLIKEALGAKDRLALVLFDSSVHVEFNFMEMNQHGKDAALKAVREISSGSCTNLSGGLFSGINLCKEAKSDVSAVVLLTDGMMNEGVTDRGKLKRMLQSELDSFPSGRPRPTVFTFGYGTDADVDTCTEIAQCAGGTFYSISDPERVPIAFADVVGGLQSVAAQMIDVKFEVNAGGEIDELLTSTFKTKMENNNKCAHIYVNDMYMGEHRDLLCRLRLSQGKTPVNITVSCTYMDVILETSKTLVSTLTMNRIEGYKPKDTDADVEIARHVARIDVTRALGRAQTLADASKMDEARKILESEQESLKVRFQQLNIKMEDDDMLSELSTDLRDASKGMESTDVYMKLGKANMMQNITSHSNQRAGKTITSQFLSNDADEFDDEEDGNAAASKKFKSSYQTAAKRSMISKASAAFGL